MNIRTLAIAALIAAGAAGTSTANAYMGDGCGPNAQLRASPYSGRIACRPIFRESMVAMTPPAVAFMPPPVVVVRPQMGGFGPTMGMMPAYPRVAVVPGLSGFAGGHGGPYVNRLGMGPVAGMPGAYNGRIGVPTPGQWTGGPGHRMR